MNKKSFSWREQLQVGDRGEELLLEHYPSPLVVYPANKADFRRLSDGKLLELKTDTYSLEHTENCFFERWGNLDKTKPGGPWRARKDSVPIFIYYFVRHNIWLEWDTKELCKVLDKKCKKSKLIPVKTHGWAVLGYKVPILDVLSISQVHTFETSSVSGREEWEKFMRRVNPV